MIICNCEVCKALAGIEERHLTDAEEIARQLPPRVQQILAAQGRLLRLRPDPGDEEIVKQAANRCTAGRFERGNGTH